MNVTREGREGIFLVGIDEIIKFIRKYKGKTIHHISTTNNNIFIGCDCSKKSVIDKIKSSERIAIMTGEPYEHNLSHALSVIENNELNLFDVGELDSNDFNIQEKEDKTVK